MTTTTASAISAALRRGGLNPLGSGTSRNREGLRVTGNSRGVTVIADLDRQSEAARLSTEAEAALADRYTVVRHSPSQFSVR